MEQNKTGKYIKYAIGEIILVVIGILIALQINNWNQNRVDRITEKKLLNSINSDFLQNKKEFEKTKSLHEIHLSCLERIVALLPLNGNEILADSIAYYERLKTNHTFNPSSSTVDAIVNSNSIDLLQNDALKQFLVSWKSVLLDYQEEEESYYNFLQENYYPFLIQSADFMDFNPLEIYSTKEYQNYAHFRRGYVRGIIKAIKEEPIENHINEIIRLTKPKYD